MKNWCDRTTNGLFLDVACMKWQKFAGMFKCTLSSQMGLCMFGWLLMQTRSHNANRWVPINQLHSSPLFLSTVHISTSSLLFSISCCHFFLLYGQSCCVLFCLFVYYIKLLGVRVEQLIQFQFQCQLWSVMILASPDHENRINGIIIILKHVYIHRHIYIYICIYICVYICPPNEVDVPI